MDLPKVHTLEYAKTSTQNVTRSFYRTILVICALGGISFNSFLIYLAVDSYFKTRDAYHKLVINPSAFGREVDSETIASLHHPVSVWISSALLGIAAIYGIILAIYLLHSIHKLNTASSIGWRGLFRYRRIKWIGIIATAIAFFWFITANSDFWTDATRHHAIGSGPPVFETPVLIFFAWFPMAWIGKVSDS